jgi:hypothetical protein
MNGRAGWLNPYSEIDKSFANALRLAAMHPTYHIVVSKHDEVMEQLTSIDLYHRTGLNGWGVGTGRVKGEERECHEREKRAQYAHADGCLLQS